ncbi:MAG: hypothetical protein LBD94_01565 [Rickettsiales bacterium]|jgi:hypothetical protein|nr:hypothetical protein [Rickettsiales bacterium]
MSDGSLSEEEINALLTGAVYPARNRLRKSKFYPIVKGPDKPDSFVMRGYEIAGLLEDVIQNER